MHFQNSSTPRRRFLRTCGGATAVLALKELEIVAHLPSVSAAEASLKQDAVQFHDDIEPLVRLLEDTPRSKVVETFAQKIRSGTTYREVLTALLLAGVRNVQPRPSVGFKFHAVLVVNSAHLASLASSDQDRWLPIFWALDYFKSSQQRDVEEGNWTMAPVDESSVPPPHRARKAFQQAMDRWDVDAADAAVAGLVRSAGANDVFELMAHYGCRDFRSIGHKAIFVANGFRTLNCIGWRYAEPVLRSLTYALLNHHGEPNPSQSDLAADSACRVTESIMGEFDQSWNGGSVDATAALDHLGRLRDASPEEAVRETAAMIQSGIHPQSISDALFLSAGEMLMQQPGIIALHSSTTTNAMQYAYRTAKNRKTRLRLLLQNAAFIPHFRQSMQSRGKVAETRIDEFRNAAAGDDPASVQTIFESVSRNRGEASREALNYLNAGGQAEDMIHAARQLVFLKGNDSHDYKFSSAVLEDFYALSPEFRNSYLAASTFLLPGSGDRDNGLVDRIRGALA
ncbi:hypothetical protein FYK55_02675 [Roseiconus nitratireducens]|uniref:Uncharacterized protein n=1 Tax=Roseiconus nitratireducens TaxID=2605748 RepID=A0A5M6DE84_9BACT|nr:hypothetical protein [Roseiconus nitratireducens]KAA5545844.1 hypothetical protein FYK55_02675 [Roseiconus nitratireducens]